MPDRNGEVPRSEPAAGIDDGINGARALRIDDEPVEIAEIAIVRAVDVQVREIDRRIVEVVGVEESQPRRESSVSQWHLLMLGEVQEVIQPPRRNAMPRARPREGRAPA